MNTKIMIAILGLVVMATIAGSFLYGKHVGTLAETAAVATNIAKQQQKTITIVKKQTVIDTAAVSTLQKQLDAEKSLNSKLTNQVSSLQESQLSVVTPATGSIPASCSLSQDFVDIYNQSMGLQ